ncbi:MAG: VOC family protein [Dehalococcoidia bacterium]
MITGIDHCVIVVADLEQAMAAYRELGFAVQPGGVHGSGQSHNALVGFADGSYFELYAFLDRENARNRYWLASLERGGGVTDLCLKTTGLAADVSRLGQAGLPYPEEFAMTRNRPDGQVVAWRLSTPVKGDDRWLPFLIEDDTPRALRVPSGDEAVHPNGATGIARVEIAASDVAGALADLAAIAGVAAGPDGVQVGAATLAVVSRQAAGAAVDGPIAVSIAGTNPAAPRLVVQENARLTFV